MLHLELKFPFPKSIKKCFSQWILDAVETWPQAENGLIFELQADRKRQRQEAKASNNKSKPPENIKFEYIGFRLFRLYSIEEFSELKNSISNILEKGNDYNKQRFNEEFSSIRESILSGHWYNLGVIHRPHGNSTFVNSLKQMELPEEVQFIQVSIQKIYPSVISVIFDITLSPEVSKMMLNIQRDKYMPEIIYNSIYLPIMAFSSIEKSTQYIQAEKLKKWKENIKDKIDRIISSNFKGKKSNNTISQVGFPAIEIYCLDVDDQVVEDFASWYDENYFWFDSLGFIFSSYKYISKKIFLYWEYFGINENLAPFKIILFKKPMEEAMWIDSLNLNRDISLFNLQPFLDAITRPLAIITNQYFDLLSIQKLREKIYREFERQNRWDINFAFDEFYQIQNILRKIERNKKEFRESQDMIKNTLKKSDAFELYRYKKSQKTNEKITFIDDVISEIILFNKKLFEHISFLEKNYSSYTRLLNTRAIYHLQRITIWITVGALVISIIGVLIPMEEVVQAINNVRNFLHFGFTFFQGVIELLLHIK